MTDPSRASAPHPPRPRLVGRARVRRVLSVAWKVALGAGLIGVIWYAAGLIDWAVLGDTLAGIDLRWFFAGLVANLGSVWLAALRWRVAMSGQVDAPVGRLFGYAMQGHGLSLLVPGPSNELAKIYLLRKRHGAATPVATALVSADKLLDGLCLALFVLSLPLWLALDPVTELVLVALGAGGIAFIATCCIAVRRLDRAGWPGRWGYLAPLSDGLGPFRDARILAGAVAVGLAATFTDVVALLLYMRAVGIELGFASGVLALLGVVVSFVLPSVPGRIGSLEAGAAGALVLLGVSLEQATAFALTFHAAQLGAILIGGADGLATLRAARRDERLRLTAAHAPA